MAAIGMHPHKRRPTFHGQCPRGLVLLRNDLDFLQMRGRYRVTGKAGDRTLDFTAPGAAETFRGR